ncbi:MAG: hypothetical protein P1P63_05300 [Treponemataceae bacterium]
MKNFKFLGLLLLLAITVMGCNFTIGGAKKKGDDAEISDLSSVVSWEDEKSYCVRVKNESTVDLIAFKGTIEKENLLSGVKAHSEAGLKLVPELFTNTCDFALQFITKKQYEENKNNLSALKNQAFTSCYAFYNKNGENNILYRISDKLGGDAKLVCRNSTDFNIELRVDSPDGVILGYVPARNANLVLNVEAGKDMVIFPVFRRYSVKKNEMYSINPVTAEGNPLATQRSFKKGETVLNIAELRRNASLTNFTTGGCYVTMINNNSNTGVVFKKAADEVVTSLGVKTVNPSEAETYFIPFPKADDGSLPDSVKFKLGASTFASTTVYAPNTETFELKKDCAYKITVSGTSMDSITVSDIEPYGENNKIDVNKALFGKDE